MVEDREVTRLLWQRWLNRQPDLLVLDAFADGESALQALPQRAPDVLMVDWHLGEGRMDGIELIRQVKQCLPRVRCLICTAYDSDGLPACAVRAGACGFLYKSDPLMGLPAAIRAAAADQHPISAAATNRLVKEMQQPAAAVDEANGLLSPRQHEILRLLAKGLPAKQVADRLSLTENTVTSYRKVIFRRLGVTKLVEAMARVRMDT